MKNSSHSADRQAAAVASQRQPRTAPLAGATTSSSVTLGPAEEGEHSGPSEATILLEAHRRGEVGALDRLVDLVYDDLRRIARSQLRKRAGRRELETTALVNEAYLRLIEGSGLVGSSRQHFLAVCARAMRFVLIDFARERIAQKRGGGQADATLEEDLLAPAAAEELANVLALHDALEEMGDSAPRLVQVVECRYFAGLSLEETAEVLSVSTRTVERDWRLARAQLRRILGDGGSHGAGPVLR